MPSEKLILRLDLIDWTQWNKKSNPSVIGPFCDKVREHISKCISQNVTVTVNLTLDIPSWKLYENCKQELIDLLAAASVTNVKMMKNGPAYFTSLYGRTAMENFFNTVPFAPKEQ